MIIKGKPEIGLQKHQQEAYKSIIERYQNDNKAAIVLPTGCGKTFVALQFMVENKDKKILFMAPTIAIKSQIYNYIAKYVANEEPTENKTARMIAEKYFPNLKIMLYPSLLKVNDQLMNKLNPDIIIMDELHRTGAEKWGERIDVLLEKNPKAKILGLTATPDRMDNKNMIDQLFEGTIDYELTLVEAVRDRIVKPPLYVKCDYTLGEHLQGIKEAIENCKDERDKKELQNKYEKMRKIIEQADGISKLFAKNIKKKDGKYIVFCKDKKQMDELMNKAKEWFKDIDSSPEIYSVYHGKGYTKSINKKTIDNFETSNSEHIKLLFSIEMLNEGVHIEDISGVIMVRPTDSRIIYLQQLGRALSSDITLDKTIVFDLVNNYLKNNLDAEVNKKTFESRNSNPISNKDKQDKIEDTDYIDIFKIQGETKEFLDLLYEVKGILSRNTYLENAIAIKEWIEKSGDTKPPSRSSKDKEEKTLGNALHSIKQNLQSSYYDLKTEEEKEEYRKKHPELEEVIRIIEEIDKNNVPTLLRNARKIKEWIERSGDTKPPSTTAKDEEEKTLGTALRSIRKGLIKKYENKKTEEEKEEYRKKHPELEEVMSIVAEIDRNNIPAYLKNARKIKEWIEKSGDTKPPSTGTKDEEEGSLATKLASIRTILLNPYKNKKTEEEKEEYRKEHPEVEEVKAIIAEIDKNNTPKYLRNAREIKEWIEKSGDTKPPSSKSKEKEEKDMGTALRSIKQNLLEPYNKLETEEEKEEYRKEHPEVEEVKAIIAEIDKNNIHPYLKHARKIRDYMNKPGIIKIPSSSSKNDEERKMGQDLTNIRQNCLKRYNSLATEERENYRKAFPELQEIMEIVSQLDMEYGTPKQKNLAMLIQQDIEKRKALKEAIKLEKIYEEQLSKKEKTNSKAEEDKEIGGNPNEQ